MAQHPKTLCIPGIPVFNLAHKTGLIFVTLTLAISRRASFGCLVLIKSPCLDKDTAGVLILTFLLLTSLHYQPERPRGIEDAVDSGATLFPVIRLVVVLETSRRLQTIFIPCKSIYFR